MKYNADLLAKVLPRIQGWESSLDNEIWFSLAGFLEFGVESQLAPQAVEEPFLSILQRLVDARQQRKQLLLPRGHTKTSLFKAIMAYLIVEPSPMLGGPRMRATWAGESGKFARRNVKALRTVLETNSYILNKYGQQKPTREDILEWKSVLADRGVDLESISLPEWTTSQLRTRACLLAEIEAGNRYEEPTITAQGPQESTTGSHYDLIVMDDLVTMKSAKSAVLKERATDYLLDLQSQLNPNRLLVDIGTRHAEDDIHHVIQQDYFQDYTIEVHEIWGEGPRLGRDDFERQPDGTYLCTNPDADILWLGFGQLEKDVERGERLSPGERKQKALAEIGLKMWSMPSGQFARQYENRTVSQEEQVFFDWMFRAYRPRDLANMRLHHYILTDSATGKDMRSSYRVVAVVAMDYYGTAYVRDLKFGHWSPQEYGMKILEENQRWDARRVLMERASWQAAFKAVLDLLVDSQNGKFPRPKVTDVPGRTLVTKYERIEGLEPRLRQGKLLFDPMLREKECDGKQIWKEMVAQFVRVREAELERNNKLLIDIPDALSDIDAHDERGIRICMSPKKKRKALGEPMQPTPGAAMRPVREAREGAKVAARRAGSNLWGDETERPVALNPQERRGLWD